MLRPYSADDLLPLDPARFSDEAMKVRYHKTDELPLPPPPTDGTMRWVWCSGWRIDSEGGGKAEDGWQYAFNWNTGWLSSSNPITHVRRRRWVRQAELRETLGSLPPFTLEEAGEVGGEGGGGCVGGGGWGKGGGGSCGSEAVPARGVAAALLTAARVTYDGLSGGQHGRGRGGKRMEGFGRDSFSDGRGKQPAAVGSPPAASHTGLSAGVPYKAGVGSDLPCSGPSSPNKVGVESSLTKYVGNDSPEKILVNSSVLNSSGVNTSVANTSFENKSAVPHSSVKKSAANNSPVNTSSVNSSDDAAAGLSAFSSLALQVNTAEGARLRVHIEEVGISISAAGSPSQGSSVSMEGAASDDTAACVIFENEINLMDFVADVQEIYRAFTGTMTSQTSTFASGGVHYICLKSGPPASVIDPSPASTSQYRGDPCASVPLLAWWPQQARSSLWWRPPPKSLMIAHSTFALLKNSRRAPQCLTEAMRHKINRETRELLMQYRDDGAYSLEEFDKVLKELVILNPAHLDLKAADLQAAKSFDVPGASAVAAVPRFGATAT
ncbi:MAG: hypothetical protein SGPRY_008158 [Prymnesium sp.]